MRSILSGTGLALFLITAPARADLTLDALGGPIPGNSWSQGLQLVSDPATSGSFEGLGVVLTLDNGAVDFVARLYEGFEVGPGLPGLDFSESWATAGWRENYALPGPEFAHTAVASGVKTNELYWQAHFRDDPETQAFTTTLYTYDLLSDLFPKGTTSAHWTGTAWKFNTAPGVPREEFPMLHAPVPNAVLLAGIGLGLVGLIERRMG